ncbi:hypothetical protein CYMTET_49691 [Cymbomonas tetramitiformis]|uniref:Uncharacterized protein n=1 Tax=Cymbomonas tetramitiformis TaxID=36881 RepID=A0AAE0ETW4_9CHLO|nr:hypothetical protein CYMTET_49691 [Cymbomonas tetramitiformis]
MRATVLDETKDPAPQLALVRRLCERHQQLRPDYSDKDRVADLWHVLSESAKRSPHVPPLYLVVLRELRGGQHFTFDRLALRIRVTFRDEAPLATLSPSSTSDSQVGSGYRPKGIRPTPPDTPTAMALRPQHQSSTPLEGEWKAESASSLYKKWVGRGFPCVTCFRMWAVTDAHTETRGACPYACKESFANNKHLDSSRPAVARPSLRAPPPAAATALQAAPQPNPQAGVSEAAFRSVRLNPALDYAPPPADVDRGDLVVQDELPPSQVEFAAFQEDEEDWPAFRESPVYVPGNR